MPGIRHLKGAVVTDTSGRLGPRSITVRLANGTIENIRCVALGVSGGWNPNVALTSHHGARPVWDDTIAGFVPGLGGAAGGRCGNGRIFDRRSAAQRGRRGDDSTG